MISSPVLRRGLLVLAILGVLAGVGIAWVHPFRGGIKDLMDHWKTPRVIIKEVPVDSDDAEDKDKDEREEPPRVIVKETRVPVEVIKEVEVKVEVPVPVEVVKEKIVYRDIEADASLPPPPPLPQVIVPNKPVEIKELFNRMQIRTDVAVRRGGLPSVERERDESYRAHFQVVVNVPQASDTMAEVARVNSLLPKMLPGLNVMLSKGKVSGFFHLLYKHKLEHTREKLTNLEQTLSRHNFYDCQTILELVHPVSKQMVLLVQGDMDVVADGSDGDRMAALDPIVLTSASYQPETSYRWPKQSSQPNPASRLIRERLQEARTRLAKVDSANRGEKETLEYRVKRLTSTLSGLDKSSFLIATEDPFIVLPLSMRPYVGHHPHAPGMGDYAVVIYKDRIFPAICGDYGPQTKIGEGSLRMAKAINPKSTPMYRPVSDVSVTYLIFPGSRDLPPGPPDYSQWSRKCLALVEAVGGLGANAQLHSWEDRLGTLP